MIKGNKVLDLITGDYTGRWPQEFKPGKNGGSKPIIRPSGNSRMQVFPYEIDDDVNVRKFTSESGEVINVLVPTTDIYNFDADDVEESPWGQLVDEVQSDVSHKDQKIESLKQKNAELEAKLERLEDEDTKKKTEDTSRSTGQGRQYSCQECGRVNSESSWEDNNRMCPHCQQGVLEQARVMQ